MNKSYQAGNVRTPATPAEVKHTKTFPRLPAVRAAEMCDSLGNPCSGNPTHAGLSMAVASKNSHSVWQWSLRLSQPESIPMIRIKVEKQDSGFTPAGHHHSPLPRSLAQTYPASSQQLHLITLADLRLPYLLAAAAFLPQNFYSILP